jgi:hypothetical protein
MASKSLLGMQVQEEIAHISLRNDGRDQSIVKPIGSSSLAGFVLHERRNIQRNSDIKNANVAASLKKWFIHRIA